jgi:succinate-acetate transporter protein
MSRDPSEAYSRTTYERFLEFERIMRVYPRGVAQGMNPTPLGFCAFALTLFVYSMIMAGATVPIQTSSSGAMGLALFYGGLILLIAGLLEFRVGNNFYALAFCSYAGYWLGLAALYINGSFGFFASSGNSITTTTDITVQQKALGIFYIGWVIFTLCMLISSVRTNVVLIAFFFFLMLAYLLWAASYFLISTTIGLQQAGGAIGIFTSAIAWFLGFSSLLKKGDNAYFNLPNYSLEPPHRRALNEEPVELRTQK